MSLDHVHKFDKVPASNTHSFQMCICVHPKSDGISEEELREAADQFDAAFATVTDWSDDAYDTEVDFPSGSFEPSLEAVNNILAITLGETKLEEEEWETLCSHQKYGLDQICLETHVAIQNGDWTGPMYQLVESLQSHCSWIVNAIIDSYPEGLTCHYCQEQEIV